MSRPANPGLQSMINFENATMFAGGWSIKSLSLVRLGSRFGPKAGNALRPVGKFLESIDDVMTNPSLLKGQSYAQVRGMLNGSKGWVNSTMKKARGVDKGWVLRQVNRKGQPTGRLIQYHPGSRRHFSGNPYWKVSDGANVFRFPAN